MKELLKFIILILICAIIFWWALGSWLYAIIFLIAGLIFCGLKIAIRSKAEAEEQKIYDRKLRTASSENPILRTGMDSLTGEGFEQYCADLLRLDNFEKIELTPLSGDKGIDIICEKDGKKYGFQCKRYGGAVGVKAVQEAYAGASYYNCDVSVVITNSYYSNAAIQMADSIGVALWDREAIDRIIQNKINSTPISETPLKDDNKSNMVGLKIVAACLALAMAAFAVFIIVNNTFISDEDEIDYSDYDNTSTVEDSYVSEATESDDESLQDTNAGEDESDLTDKLPYIYMREADIEKTKLGKPDTVEKSRDFDVMVASHKSKEYTWGELEDHDYFSVTVRYERHLSNKVDDVETYPDNNGYVSEIYYYDSEAGGYVSKSEYDE